MTPKDKAIELIRKFGILGMHWKQTKYLTLDKENAKQCALICVDEIIESEVETTRYGIAYLQKRDYWQEVKEEITKL